MFTTKQSDVFYNDQTKEMFVCKVSSISGKRCEGPDTVFGALPIVYKINKNTNYQSIIYPKNFDTFAADNKSDIFDLLPSNYYGENTNFSSITKPLINYNKTSDRYSVTCIGRYAARGDGFGVLSYIFQYIDTNFYLLDARSYIPKAKAENNIFTFKNGYLNSDFLIGGNPLRWNQEVDTSHAERVTNYVIPPTHVDYNESLGFNLMGYCRKGVGGGSSESTCLTATRQHTFQWSGGYITYNPKYAAFDPNYDIRVDFTAKSFQVPLMTAYRSIQSDEDDPQPSRWVDTSTALNGLSGAGEGFCAFFYRNPLAGVVEPQGIGSTLGYAKASSVVSEIEGELKAVDGLVINNGGGYGDPANSFLGVGFDIKGDFCTTLEGKEGWLSAGGGPGRWSHGKHSGAFTNTTAPCSVGIRGNRNSFTRVLTCISISTVAASAVSMHQQSANSTGSDVDFQDYRIDLTHKGTRVTVYNKLTSTTDYNTILQFDLNSVKDEKGVFYRPWGGFYNRQFDTVDQGSQFPGVHAGPPPVPTAALWPGQFPGVHAGPPAIPTAALWSPQSTDEGIIIETTPSIDISPTVIPAPYGAPTTINIEPETIIIDNPSDIELYPGGRTPSQGLIAPINVGLSFTTSEYTSHFELLSFKVTGVKMGDPTKSIEKIDNITTVEYLEESSANLRKELVTIPTTDPVDITMLIKQQSLIDRITLCGKIPEFVDSEVEAKWTGVTKRRSDIPGPPGETPTIVKKDPDPECKPGWFKELTETEAGPTGKLGNLTAGGGSTITGGSGLGALLGAAILGMKKGEDPAQVLKDNLSSSGLNQYHLGWERIPDSDIAKMKTGNPVDVLEVEYNGALWLVERFQPESGTNVGGGSRSDNQEDSRWLVGYKLEGTKLVETSATGGATDIKWHFIAVYRPCPGEEEEEDYTVDEELPVLNKDDWRLSCLIATLQMSGRVFGSTDLWYIPYTVGDTTYKLYIKANFYAPVGTSAQDDTVSYKTSDEVIYYPKVPTYFHYEVWPWTEQIGYQFLKSVDFKNNSTTENWLINYDPGTVLVSRFDGQGNTINPDNNFDITFSPINDITGYQKLTCLVPPNKPDDGNPDDGNGNGDGDDKIPAHGV